jgi:hypothetical protein
VDFPEPDNPVNTTSLSRGISSEMFLRFPSLAPRMMILDNRTPPLFRQALSLYDIDATDKPNQEYVYAMKMYL